MPMKISEHAFNNRLETNLENDFMRGAVSAAQHRFQTRRSAAIETLDWEEWRNHGEEIRQHVLENLDYYLYELSENVAARGGHVFLLKPLKRQRHIFQRLPNKKCKKNRQGEVNGYRRNQFK